MPRGSKQSRAEWKQLIQGYDARMGNPSKPPLAHRKTKSSKTQSNAAKLDIFARHRRQQGSGRGRAATEIGEREPPDSNSQGRRAARRCRAKSRPVFGAARPRVARGRPKGRWLRILWHAWSPGVV
jgi:hypothetical protein